MNLNAYTSRVASFVDDLRGADWQQRIGGWTLTLVALTVAWWFLRRVRNTGKAVVGDREMPGVIPESITHVLFPLDMVIVAVFAVMAWVGAQVVWRLIGRRWHVDSLPRRLVSILVAGSVGLTALLYLLSVPIEVYEGARIAVAITENVDESWEFLTEWWVYLPIPAVATSLVASWRRGEFELTAHRRQTLAVAAVAIVVAPAVLGAVGVGATQTDGSYTPSQVESEGDIVEKMDDGNDGPYAKQLGESKLELGEYRGASALLGCGDVERKVYDTGSNLGPHYPANTTVNVSSPADVERTYIELAPYRENGTIVHGQYAYRVVNEEWSLIDTWYANPEFVDGEPWNASTGASHIYADPSTGTLAMENTEAATFGFDLVNENGEIVRVQYRLCRPDLET